MATVHEGRNSQRHGHESLPCDKAFGICEEDLSVVFDDEGSFIMNKNNGEVIWPREEDGNYMLDAWIPPPQQGCNKTSFHRRP